MTAVHQPTVAAEEPGALTLRRGADAYLDHLALRVETDGFARDGFLNIRRNLLRFLEAWHVTMPNGRNVLIPRSEPAWRVLPSGRRQRVRAEELTYGAAGEEEAILKAGKLAAATIGGPTLASTGSAWAIRVNGDRPLAEAGNDDLVRWLLVNPQWRSGHTKQNNLVSIHDCFAWVAEEFRLPASPYRRKRMPKFVRPPRREATEAEYVGLVRNGGRQLRRALWCLYNLDGIRPAEMRQMLWSDFDWDGAFVLTYLHKTARKTGKPRLFAFTPRQLRHFKNLFKRRAAGATHVFLNERGRPWTRRSLALNLRRAARRGGLDDDVASLVSAYCFRHTFATQADEASNSEQETAMLMGHSDTKQLRTIYSKASRKVRHVRRASEDVERLRRENRRQRKPRPREKKPPTEVQGMLF